VADNWGRQAEDVLAGGDPSFRQFLFGDEIQEARQDFWWALKEGGHGR
jgi:hypothetical protein